MMQKRRGFTLIELLVVIAIIALLMSILMPALARVRNLVKAVVCQSNLKQFGFAFEMYTQSNNGYFGGSYVADYSRPLVHQWPVELRTSVFKTVVLGSNAFISRLQWLDICTKNPGFIRTKCYDHISSAAQDLTITSKTEWLLASPCL